MKGKLVTLTLLATTGQALAQTAPVKVALVMPFSGVYGTFGKDMQNGFELALDEVKRKAGGRTIQVVAVEDSQTNPSVALEKTRKVVEKDGAEVVVGPISVPEALAMRDYLLTQKKLFLMTYGGGNELSAGDKCSPYLFATTHNAYVKSFPMGKYVAQKIGKKAFIVGSDYAWGRDHTESFEQSFKAAGGTVIGKKFVPLGTKDFAPLVTEIAQAKPELIYTSISGTDGISFLKLLHDFGLDKTVKVTGIDDVVGYPTSSDTFGDILIGDQFVGFWSPFIENSKNKAFVTGYTNKYKTMPSPAAVVAYDAGQALVRALNITKGNSSSEALRRAIEKMTISSPRGPIQFDQNHMVRQPMYVFEMVKQNGKMVPIVKARLGMSTSKDFGCKGSASR